MGYANRKVKMRRHSNTRRLHAAVLLHGEVNISPWTMPYRLRNKRMPAKGYEVFIGDYPFAPYKLSFGAAVHHAANRLGVK